jgi:catechol 2,3-dioxygenase-like lactoylglutathione lyase family enzyme
MTTEMRLELVQVPVSDIDRAKAFYVEKLGFSADHDHQVTNELRFVQLTSPGSVCSIALTSGVHQMKPGSIDGLQIVRGHEKVPACGQVHVPAGGQIEVPAGGQIEVLTPR